MLAEALDPYTLRMVLLPVLGALAIAAYLVLRFVTRGLVKVLLIAALVVVGVSISEQRAGLADCVHTSECTIFGRVVEVRGR